MSGTSSTATLYLIYKLYKTTTSQLKYLKNMCTMWYIDTEIDLGVSYMRDRERGGKYIPTCLGQNCHPWEWDKSVTFYTVSLVHFGAITQVL